MFFKNGRHKQRSCKHTLTWPKNIQKNILQRENKFYANFAEMMRKKKNCNKNVHILYLYSVVEPETELDTVGTETFCLSGTRTKMHSGSGLGSGAEKNGRIKVE